MGVKSVFRNLVALPLACLALLAASGCSSSSGSKNTHDDLAAGSSDNAGARIGVMCLGDLINSPSEPFHYSYHYVDASGGVDKEADITLQAMDITVKDKSGTHSYRGVRSDDASWNRAVLDLSGLNLTRMSATLDSLNDRFSSAFSKEGSETVNGYQTTRYAIDTEKANSSDKKRFETLFGKGSFEKGTVWVPADGCAVKLVLDEGLWQSDGSVRKDHYDIARIKK